MSLSLSESQAINEIAKRLYEFLPGKAHPFADQRISFLAAAHDCGVGPLWSGGSKLPAIASLLQETLEHHRDRFCPLLLEVIKRGLIYRNSKRNPITREE